MMSRARAEARKALELMPSHPMAQAVLGTIAALHDYDWKEAEEQFRPARASGSLSLNGRFLSAMFYSLARGQFDDALREMADIIAQDPLNPFWRARHAWVYVCAGRYDEAIAQAQRALEFDGTNYQARMMIALSLTFQGQLAAAQAKADEVFRIASFDALNTGLLAGLLARAGEQDRAQEVLTAMSGRVPIGTAMYHLVCGEIDSFGIKAEPRVRDGGPPCVATQPLEPFPLPRQHHNPRVQVEPIDVGVTRPARHRRALLWRSAITTDARAGTWPSARSP
jgi:Tfp pilus assembly protein PilF